MLYNTVFGTELCCPLRRQFLQLGGDPLRGGRHACAVDVPARGPARVAQMGRDVEDVAEGWEPRELERIAFIAPKSAGMRRANEENEEHRCRNKNGDGPLSTFEEFRIHFWRQLLRFVDRLGFCRGKSGCASVNKC